MKIFNKNIVYTTIVLIGTCVVTGFIFEVSFGNRHLLVLSQTLSLRTVHASFLNEGLMAHYTFDEGNGTITADTSGNGNIGTLKTVNWVGGKVGNGALNFDGIASHYVQIAPAPTLNINGAVTVSAWIKPTITPKAATTIFSKGAANNLASAEQYILKTLGSGKLSFEVSNGTALLSVGASSGVIPQANTWYYVVGTYNGTDTVRLYINGVLSSTAVKAGFGNLNPTPNSFIGIGSDNSLRPWNGLIDDVLVYNRDLSLSEINDIYNGGLVDAVPTLSPTPTPTPSPSPSFSPSPSPTPTPSPSPSFSPSPSPTLTSTPSPSPSPSPLTQPSSNVSEIIRFSETLNTRVSGRTRSIILTSDVSAGDQVVMLLGWEAPASIAIATITDSVGNVWQVQGKQLNSTVHQQAIISSSLTSTLHVGDTINITWTGTGNMPRFAGSLIDIKIGDISNIPGTIIINRGYGTNVKLPGTIVTPNAVILGIMQTQQPTVYSNSNWTQIGVSDNFGQSSSTIGLTNTYLYTIATSTGIYNPGGTLSQVQVWQGIWVAFNP
jgi:hypothetical protein